MNEFELIRTYFQRVATRRVDVVLGIGDDCALVTPPPDMTLAVTTDLLVEGVHFFAGTAPAALGRKALAVSLSDLAAMGAVPAWFTLNLSLPRADAAWLEAFSAGMFDLARRYNIELIGGDTVRGPLTVGVQACGFVPNGRALRRDGARVGDRVFVSGELGDAGLALRARRGELSLAATALATVNERLDLPQPRIEAGIALREIANSAIDISDGLLADLGHILERSGVGARIDYERVPVSETYRQILPLVGWGVALANGDDYELCFTVPAGRLENLANVRSRLGCQVTEIGEIVAGRELIACDSRGIQWKGEQMGHDHFASEP
ncbi:MAG: thiamine-phosphate kinase [Pseudomonadota bacterium]|nr:MAG: thiamine-phosphate kinase [Pseudomonadota bacterium]